METAKKLEMLEDILELDPGELHEDDVLAELENWDSMAKLSLIVMMDDDFGKKLTGDQIKTFATVRDILDFMG